MRATPRAPSWRLRLARILLIALASGCSLGAAPIAYAQPPAASSAADVARAKKLFEAGLRAKREERYDAALAAFEEANRLAPRESIQNNLALVHRLMADMAGAYEAYEVLLSTYGAAMKPALRTEAQRALDALEVLTGQITVGIDEPGARVTVDGKSAGTTPLSKPLRVNVGPHTVSIAKAGFDTLERSVGVLGHDVLRVDGPLAKAVTTGHVTIDVKQTTPPDATVHVLVDGKDVGAPPFAGDLAPGAHTLEARGASATCPPRSVTVEAKTTTYESLVLRALSGTLVVTVDVPGVEIAVDGHAVGHGAYEGPLAAGSHALVVTEAGHAPHQVSLVVKDGERLVENMALRGGALAHDARHDWKGLYARVDFVALFGATKPSNDVAQGVGYTAGTPITGSSVIGGALGVRAGYSFGVVGLEGAVLLGYDHSWAQVMMGADQATFAHPGPTPRNEGYDFYRFGGTGALGIRLMPKTRVVRPTIGVAGGTSLKGIFYRRTVAINTPSLSGTYSQNTNPAFYLAPTLLVDAGVQFGTTPNARFYVGALMEADFSRPLPMAPSVQDSNFPSRGLDAVNGVDLFIGPVLGVQLGE